jgi:hypothetical protein
MQKPIHSQQIATPGDDGGAVMKILLSPSVDCAPQNEHSVIAHPPGEKEEASNEMAAAGHLITPKHYQDVLTNNQFRPVECAH